MSKTAVALLVAMLSCAAFAYDDRGMAASAPGEFDYYILSLGWSPTYCAGPGGQKEYSREQCNQPLGFIIHGLWPEIAGGPHPDSCARGSWLDFKNLQPVQTGEVQIPPGANGLMIHEWQKHGTCSGLSQAEYFQTVHAAAAKIQIPEKLRNSTTPISMSSAETKALFVAVNPELAAEKFEVRLNREGQFAEVRFCFDKTLQFTECRGMQMMGGEVQGVFLPVAE